MEQKKTRVRGNEPGPTSETAAFNIRRMRLLQGLDLRALSERLANLGHSISPSALSKLENGDRRVDVDDLIALALALGANPNALLLPPVEDPGFTLRLTGGTFDASRVWPWARGDQPLTFEAASIASDKAGLEAGREIYARSREIALDKFRARVTPGYSDDFGPNVR